MKNKKIILIIVITALLVLTMLGTYAYLSTSDKQTTANTFNSGCLSITIDSETSAITLTNSYPISDVEGLSITPYTFTIKNNCSTAANYQINLENLNQTTNTLSSDYVKVSLSSDTSDNLISILSSNDTATTTITGAYEAYTLYTGTIAGNGTTKTFNLREWIDYDVTVSQGANKTFTNKINVIANPEIEVTETPEIQFVLSDTTLIGTINGSASTATYCTTTQNICIPTTSTAITNNQINIIFGSGEKIFCASLDNNRTICSEPQSLSAKNFILAEKNITTRTDFSIVLTADTTGTIYTAEDDDGTSYYFAGAPTDNWVKFAGFYWRIIRINGDESIRLIYQGTSTTATGIDTQIGTSAFNSKGYNNMHVGYMYTLDKVHGYEISSTIKGILDDWYKNNLANYTSYVDENSGFCNDRTPYTDVAGTAIGGGTGKTQTYYGAYIRLYANNSVSDATPSLKCTSSSDLFTKSGATKGNKALTYPIGLITADEVAYAGGVYFTANENYYLNTAKDYWTLSPAVFSNNSLMHWVGANGWILNLDLMLVACGVRPVINLMSDTQFKEGSLGTAESPYEVV